MVDLYTAHISPLTYLKLISSSIYYIFQISVSQLDFNTKLAHWRTSIMFFSTVKKVANPCLAFHYAIVKKKRTNRSWPQRMGQKFSLGGVRLVGVNFYFTNFIYLVLKNALLRLGFGFAFFGLENRVLNHPAIKSPIILLITVEKWLGNCWTKWFWNQQLHIYSIFSFFFLSLTSFVP